MCVTKDIPPRRYVSAREVAERAGVSRSAVSRALTDGASISPEMKERVLTAARELGYEINMLARGLLDDRSMIVSLVSASLGSPFTGMMLPELTDRLIASGYAPMLINIGTTPSVAEESLRQVIRLRSAAVIILSGSPPPAFVEAAQRTGIPVIALNRDEPGVDVIAADGFAAGRDAFRHLAAAGSRHLLVSPARDTYSMRSRIAGFQAEALEQGHATSRIVKALRDAPSGGRSDYDDGLAIGKDIFAGGERIDGVFCLNDHTAFGVIDGARRRHGLEAGRDFSIIGFDDVPMAAWDAYRLASFRQDPVQFAAAVMNVLEHRAIAPQDAPMRHRIGSEFIRRASLRTA